MGEPMRALTVRQPWAGCIAHLDKRVENRSKLFPSPLLGVPIAIHAGLAVEKGDALEWPGTREQWASLFASDAEWDAWRYWRMGQRRRDTANWPPKLALGAVVAVAAVTGCHHSGPGIECGDGSYAYGILCSRWASWRDGWHWQLASVRPLPEPVPCRGMLGLWRLPEDTEKAVRAQLEER